MVEIKEGDVMNVDLGIRATVYDLLGYLIPGACALATGWSVYALSALDAGGPMVLVSAAFHSGLAFWVLFFIASYVAGHAVNALSSLLIEKLLATRCRCSKRAFHWLDRLSDAQKQSLNSLFHDTFARDAETRDWFLIMAYVDKCAPPLAITALRFESIYGMARSLGFLCLTWAIWPWCFSIWNLGVNAAVTSIAGLGFIIFFWQYTRFVAYHRDYLTSALLVLGAEQRAFHGPGARAHPGRSADVRAAMREEHNCET